MRFARTDDFDADRLQSLVLAQATGCGDVTLLLGEALAQVGLRQVSELRGAALDVLVAQIEHVREQVLIDGVRRWHLVRRRQILQDITQLLVHLAVDRAVVAAHDPQLVLHIGNQLAFGDQVVVPVADLPFDDRVAGVDPQTLPVGDAQQLAEQFDGGQFDQVANAAADALGLADGEIVVDAEGLAADLPLHAAALLATLLAALLATLLATLLVALLATLLATAGRVVHAEVGAFSITEQHYGVP